MSHWSANTGDDGRRRLYAIGCGQRRRVRTRGARAFLVHGSSASGRSSFVLDVPGRNDYSLMDLYAALGTMCGRWTTKATVGPIARKRHEPFVRRRRSRSGDDYRRARNRAAARDAVRRLFRRVARGAYAQRIPIAWRA